MHEHNIPMLAAKRLNSWLIQTLYEDKLTHNACLVTDTCAQGGLLVPFLNFQKLKLIFLQCLSKIFQTLHKDGIH